MQQYQYSRRSLYVVKSISDLKRTFSVISDSSFMLGSYDEDDGPQLYMVDPSGISYVR